MEAFSSPYHGSYYFLLQSFKSVMFFTDQKSPTSPPTNSAKQLILQYIDRKNFLNFCAVALCNRLTGAREKHASTISTAMIFSALTTPEIMTW